MSVWTEFDPNGKPDENWPGEGNLVLLYTAFGHELGRWLRGEQEDEPIEWYDEKGDYNDAPQDWGGTAYWTYIPEFDA